MFMIVLISATFMKLLGVVARTGFMELYMAFNLGQQVAVGCMHHGPTQFHKKYKSIIKKDSQLFGQQGL